MSAVIDWLVTFVLLRAQELSTWMGILTFITGAVGWETTDKQVGDLAEAFTMIFGVITAVAKEREAKLAARAE